MNILCSYCSAQTEVNHSRFIAEVFPITSQEEARTLLKEQKKKYKDASHVVHAFVIGKNAEILGMSDDGEPSGTAGRPVLDVLKGKECTNIMITITRYFGGVLLGTGGLVKAYGDAAKKVLETITTELLIDKTEFTLQISYDQYDLIKIMFKSLDVEVISENFETSIKITGKIKNSDIDLFIKNLKDYSKGQAIPVFKKD